MQWFGSGFRQPGMPEAARSDQAGRFIACQGSRGGGTRSQELLSCEAREPPRGSTPRVVSTRNQVWECFSCRSGRPARYLNTASSGVGGSLGTMSGTGQVWRVGRHDRSQRAPQADWRGWFVVRGEGPGRQPGYGRPPVERRPVTRRGGAKRSRRGTSLDGAAAPDGRLEKPGELGTRGLAWFGRRGLGSGEIICCRASEEAVGSDAEASEPGVGPWQPPIE